MFTRLRWSPNAAQRVVIVVAYGLSLWALWHWIEVEGWEQVIGDGGGSLNFTLGAGVVLNGATEMRTNVGLRLWVQLGLVLAWMLPSLWLLRSSEPQMTRRDQQ
jgi:hypothetical protein